MITALTLNPCIDHTINVAGFKYGGTNKVLKTFKDVAGKGIDSNIVIMQMGRPTRAIIFEYADGLSAAKELEKMGIECRSIPVEGELRTNIKIFDEETTEMSECNASGNPVKPKDADKMLELIIDSLSDTEILIVNGSVPPGVPSDFYYKVITEAKKRGIPTILDADNQLFAEGVKAAPTLVKPNRNELEKYTGRKLESLEDVREAAREIIALGIKYVCVSMGAQGCALFTEDKSYFAASAEIEVRGVQGAGDSLVAGFAMAMIDGATDEEMLRRAVATANGSLTRDGTKLCRPEDYEKVIDLIVTKEID